MKTKGKEVNKIKKIEILYEDEYLIIINKPAGMLSVPYPGSHSKTALQYIEDIMRKNGTWTKVHRPFAVHRLDRETSGVMIFALTETMEQTIMNSWHKMVTERIYHAVAENPHGNKIPKLPDRGIINDELAFNKYHAGYVPQDKSGDEKTVKARTHFQFIERGEFYSLIELNLDTGKKNQIRAHLAGRHYPLAGDENYRAKSDPFGRLALHARTLEFVHPVTKEKMHFEVPESDSWLKTVKETKTNKYPASWNLEVKFSEDKAYEEIEKNFHYESRKNLRKMDFIQRGKAKKR